ncbi:uncharacterized protein LOC133309393 [Gastrolobium bilobum]|uniref:uncharacterized protein LOC133309393 n=1 Tax=Gastrolobium bilobum TaxID=150636 RepID=UPI002AB260DB|nr:uncharacterized protein LOC133309393 [Gastrolobium bilobum]
METRRASEREVEDLLERSVKKAKENGVEDSHMGDEMNEEELNEEGEKPSGRKDPLNSESSYSPVDGKKLVSYKDIVLQLNGEDDEGGNDEDDWMSIQRKEEDDFGRMEEEVPVEQKNPFCPVYHFSMAQHKEDCKKWRSALIIKLLGRKISNRFLISRLLRQWSLKGRFEVIDLENGYILVNLHDGNDYHHVLHEGPWVVAEHYVTVQRWRRIFDPFDEKLRRLAVWMRIPGLPLEFYTSQHLWRIGNLFGRTLKIDRNSLRK